MISEEQSLEVVHDWCQLLTIHISSLQLWKNVMSRIIQCVKDHLRSNEIMQRVDWVSSHPGEYCPVLKRQELCARCDTPDYLSHTQLTIFHVQLSQIPLRLFKVTQSYPNRTGIAPLFNFSISTRRLNYSRHFCRYCDQSSGHRTHYSSLNGLNGVSLTQVHSYTNKRRLLDTLTA